MTSRTGFTWSQKVEFPQILENWKKAVKNSYFGTFHTFNIFHGKTLDLKCDGNNIWKYFRKNKFDHQHKMLTYDVVLTQNDIILTQNGQISHKMIYFDPFLTPLMTFVVNYFYINVVKLM